jgi:hypothetical protein
MNDAIKLNQGPIPEAALRDSDAIEVLRVWIAEKELHCSLKIGMSRKGTHLSEVKLWGTILADAAQHIANALHDEYGVNVAESIRAIQEHLVSELEGPTSEHTGEFVRKH